MPPTRPRGSAPTNPRNYTGNQFARLQKAQTDKDATRDIDLEITAAYDKGWDAAIAFVMESYLVFEKPDDFDEDDNLDAEEELRYVGDNDNAELD